MPDESEERRKEREHQMHAQNFVQETNNQDPKVLKFVSQIDDAPELDDESLDYQHSKVVSTANLTDDAVEAFEWETEIGMLRRRQAFPPKYGLKGIARAFALGSADEHREPLNELDVIKHEGHGLVSRLAATRSEEFIGVETTTSDTRESIIAGPDENSGGIRGRL